MNDTEIRRRIESFPQWHYRFDLKGNLTPIRKERLINRHEQRRRHFFNPLVQLFGGSLAGKRVLDLASNAGFWSLCAIDAGCDFVQGIEGRQMHVDQANLVFEAKEIESDRYRFVLGDIFETDLKQFGNFDIVLCLGLMYHISRPVELMEKISEVNSDVLVLDSTLSKGSGSYLELRWQNPGADSYMNSVDRGLVMHPSKQAVRDLVEEFGYSVATLKPDFRNDKGAPAWEGSQDYRGGARRAFMCSKHTDLTGLSVETESAETDNTAENSSTATVNKQPKQVSVLRNTQSADRTEQLMKQTEAVLSQLLTSRTWKLAHGLASVAQALRGSRDATAEDRLQELRGEIRALVSNSGQKLNRSR